MIINDLPQVLIGHLLRPHTVLSSREVQRTEQMETSLVEVIFPWESQGIDKPIKYVLGNAEG